MNVKRDRVLYTFGGGNFLHEWLAITLYRYQWIMFPTVGVFRTSHNCDWRIGFNWLNVAVSVRIYMPKEG